MVILSSPSGAGKTTLVKLLSKNKNFHISVSHTTREPRPREIAISLGLGSLVVWDTDIWKFLFFDKSFTSVVLPAPDGDDKITIIPSFFMDI